MDGVTIHAFTQPGDDLLYQMWDAVTRDGCAQHLLYDHRPVTMSVFYRYFFNKPVVAAYTHAGLAGFVWATDIIDGVHLFSHIYIHRPARRVVSLPLTRAGLDYAFGDVGVRTVWGTNIWPTAVAHARRAGFTCVATIPGLVPWDGELKDLYFWRMTRDEWETVRLSEAYSGS